MNKKGFLKALMLGFVIAIVAVFISGHVMAQVIKTQVMMTSPYTMALNNDGSAADANSCDIALVDNFEYWNNPRNMGWQPVEPPYPVYGYGLGYGQLNNVLDFEQGSKVLDVYRPMSVFLMTTMFEVYRIQKQCMFPSGKSISGDNCVMHLELRAPLAIEQFDQFTLLVNTKCTNSDDDDDLNFTIAFRPIDIQGGCYSNDECLASNPDLIEDGGGCLVAMGRQFQDGTWHLISPNLANIVDMYDEGATLDSIESVTVIGNQYRMDNIMFIKPAASIAENGAVHLFHVGPIYCQLYGQMVGSQGRWIHAEDGDLGITVEYDDGLVFPQIGWDGTDPIEALTYDEDGDVIIPAGMGAADLFIYDGVDPNGRPEGRRDEPGPDLHWILTMGDTLGPQVNDVTAGFVERASFDGGVGNAFDEGINTWPPYLVQEDGLRIQNYPDPNGEYLGQRSLDNPMFAVACALDNSGYDTFPNAIRIVPHLGQVFEDMVVTCRCSDGIVTDKETFPISVVNYPVTNHPPIINDVDDQIFYVGEGGQYRIVAIDPDPLDDGALTYKATLNGLPSYQYGPWMQNIIHPTYGVISFVPQFEGALDCVITVSDPRGMFAVAEITIFCINRGTWFNHPPIVLGDLDSPQTIRAGEMFIADEMDFQDPDGDRLYWSCNIGSVGDNGVYTFQTMFPGYYLVQITAYDIRGGAATTEFLLHVRPWWSL